MHPEVLCLREAACPSSDPVAENRDLRSSPGDAVADPSEDDDPSALLAGDGGSAAHTGLARSRSETGGFVVCNDRFHVFLRAVVEHRRISKTEVEPPALDLDEMHEDLERESPREKSKNEQRKGDRGVAKS